MVPFLGFLLACCMGLARFKACQSPKLGGGFGESGGVSGGLGGSGCVLGPSCGVFNASGGVSGRGFGRFGIEKNESHFGFHCNLLIFALKFKCPKSNKLLKIVFLE